MSERTINITIPYTPRFPQTEIHPRLEEHRYNVLVTHRQMGKTVMAINHMLKMALINNKPNARYFYIAPFLKQAKMLAWDYIKRFTRPYLHVNIGTEQEPQYTDAIKVNESELSVILPNKATIRVCGADNPDALRGTYADGVILDEYGDMRPNLFNEIIRPMLLSRNGWVLFFGTPKGQNQFYEVYRNARDEYSKDPAGEWWAGCYRADQTGVIPPEELKQIEAQTPESIYRQEYLCDFTASNTDTLFPAELLDKARKADFKYANGERIAALDVARFGDDSCVLKVWEYAGGMKWKELATEVWGQKDLTYTTGRVIETSRRYHFNRIAVDGTGVGGGVVDNLRAAQICHVVDYQTAEKASDPHYLNKRAEGYYTFKAMLEAGYVDMKDETCLQELSTINYEICRNGQLKIEDKDHYKDRFGKSPDYADTCMLIGPLMRTSAAVVHRELSRRTRVGSRPSRGIIM